MDALRTHLRATLAAAESRARTAPGWHQRDAASRLAVEIDAWLDKIDFADERDADEASEARAAYQAHLRLWGGAAGVGARP